MLDQTALGKGKELAVYEDISKGATYKTRNEEGQFQRTVVTSRGTKSLKYKSTVTLNTCIHGYLDASAKPPVPASLIVLDYSLSAISDEKYATAYTSLEFSKTNRVATGKGPRIVAWSPHSTKTHSSKADEVKTRDIKSEGLKVNAMGSGAEIPIKLGTSTETSAERQYFQIVQSDWEQPAGFGIGHTAVWWSMQQNPDLKDGVPPTLTTAVLVARDITTPKAQFVMDFVLRPHATKWQDLKNRFSHFWGIAEDDPVLFDPTLGILGGEGLPEGSEGRLGELCTGQDLKDLGYFKNLPVLLESSSEPGGDANRVAGEKNQWDSDVWVASSVLIVVFVLVGLLKFLIF